MTVVLMGNPCAVEAYRDPRSDDPDKVRYREVAGDRVTEVHLPDGEPLSHAYATILDVYQRHFGAAVPPLWIECEEPGLKALLLDHFDRMRFALPPDTPLIGRGRPAGWGGTGEMNIFPAGMEPDAHWGPVDFLRTTVGRDWQCRVMGDHASTGTGNYAAAYFMGLTANVTTPVPGSTSLTGEIVSGTLARGAATYAHTNGTASYTLTRTVTADAPVTINKIGIFTALSGGVLVFESALNAAAVLANLDQCTFTETVTL